MQHRRVAGHDHARQLVAAQPRPPAELCQQRSQRAAHNRLLHASHDAGLLHAQIDACQHIVTESSLGVQRGSVSDDAAGRQFDDDHDDGGGADVDGHSIGRLRHVQVPQDAVIPPVLERQVVCAVGARRERVQTGIQFERQSTFQLRCDAPAKGLAQTNIRRRVRRGDPQALPQRIVRARHIQSERRDHLRLMSQQRSAGKVHDGLPDSGRLTSHPRSG